MDLAVKWRLFRRLRHGGNDSRRLSPCESADDAEHVYRWHIQQRSGRRIDAGLATDRWKTSLDDYMSAARGLFESMREDGFALSGAVPVDSDGELLDGSHRVACALALDIETIPISREARRVWAPGWGYDWFVMNGMSHDHLARLCRDWREMGGGTGDTVNDERHPR